MSRPVTLPIDPVAMLAGRSTARHIAEKIHAAYWLHGRCDGTALALLNEVHNDFAQMAAELGYSIAPLATPVEVAA